MVNLARVYKCRLWVKMLPSLLEATAFIMMAERLLSQVFVLLMSSARTFFWSILNFSCTLAKVVQLTLYYNYVTAKIARCVLRQNQTSRCCLSYSTAASHVSLGFLVSKGGDLVVEGLLPSVHVDHWGWPLVKCLVVVALFIYYIILFFLFLFPLSHSNFQLLWIEYVSFGSTISIGFLVCSCWLCISVSVV